jgi:hypothetical protein
MSGKQKSFDGYRDDKDNYDAYLPAPGEEEDNDDTHRSSSSSSSSSRTRRAVNPSRDLLDSTLDNNTSDKELTDRYRDQFGSGLVNTRIADRENEVRLFDSYPVRLFLLILLCSIKQGNKGFCPLRGGMPSMEKPRCGVIKILCSLKSFSAKSMSYVR